MIVSISQNMSRCDLGTWYQHAWTRAGHWPILDLQYVRCTNTCWIKTLCGAVLASLSYACVYVWKTLNSASVRSHPGFTMHGCMKIKKKQHFDMWTCPKNLRHVSVSHSKNVNIWAYIQSNKRMLGSDLGFISSPSRREFIVSLHSTQSPMASNVQTTQTKTESAEPNAL
jgi:hypothetical protein